MITIESNITPTVESSVYSELASRIDREHDKFIVCRRGLFIYYNEPNDIYYIILPNNLIEQIDIDAVHYELSVALRAQKLKPKIQEMIDELNGEIKKTNEKWPEHGKISIDIEADDDVFTTYTNERSSIPTGYGTENKNKRAIVIIKNS